LKNEILHSGEISEMEHKEERRKKDIATLEQLYKNADTESAMKEAYRLFIKYKSATALNIFALCNKKLGNYKKAQEIFEKAISKNPLNTLFLGNLGNLHTDLGQWREAGKYFHKCLVIDPANFDVLMNAGNLYIAHSHLNAALSTMQRLLALLNGNSSAFHDIHHKLGEIYRKRGKEFYRQALYHYRLGKGPFNSAHRLELIYKLQNEDGFDAALEDIMISGEVNPLIGAIQKHASIRYGKNYVNVFCEEPFKYIYHGRLSQEDGFSDELRKNLIEIHTKLDSTPQDLLKNGTQSAGNFLLLQDPHVISIRKIITHHIKKYYSHYLKSNEGFINHWPKHYNLHGWIINLKTGGSLGSHMHKSGWISGSVYLNLPKVEGNNQGNIVFDLHGADYPKNDRTFPKKELAIEKGDIVIFPSSIFHWTIPFKTREERVTLAFDIKPIY